MIRTIPRAPGFDVRSRRWTTPAPPTSAPADKILMWQAGAALNLPLEAYARILGVGESTVKSWMAASGNARSKNGLGYMPTGQALAIARAILEAKERHPGLTEVAKAALEGESPLRALYVILRAAYEPRALPEPYEPTPDPFRAARGRRKPEATTSKAPREVG